jgi:hypothetical protein
MKTAFLAALAISVGLAGCALTSERALAPEPSQMATSDIQREIASISRKMVRIRNRPVFSGEVPQSSAPVVFTYTDSNGGSFTNYSRAEVQRLSSSSSRRSPAVYDEGRFNVLAQRRLELVAELRQRTRSQ